MKATSTKIMVLITLLTLTGCSLKINEPKATLPNPASVFCEENGGKIELIFDFGETYGVCHFPDGSFCEEWEYYHGECGPKGEKIGNKIETNEKDPKVTDFESCKLAGGIVKEIYPAICYFNGKDFEQKIDKEIEIDKGTDKEILTGKKLEENKPTICTSDAKLCPDGSFVGRIGPNCEFAPCPNNVNSNSNKEKIDINKIIKDHSKNIDANSTGLTEESIDLMEKIIDVLNKEIED